MFRTQLSTVAAGSVLGKTLYNERGDVLLRKGAVLTDRYLTLLREKGFQSVQVQDADTADIEIEDIVSEHVRTNATKNIYRFLQVVESASKEYQKLPPERLAAALGTSGDLRAEARGNAYEALYGVVESIIDEVLGAATLTGLTAIKTHDNYTFCHSVDVTVTAIMLGKKLFFDRTALRQLALGCMLHDAGKMFIAPNILNKPGRLTPDEFELIKKHPTLGYQMLRNIQKDEFLANHVAYQHHERQDGGGYPRGLHGTNRIHRNAAGRGQMLLIAEIAAVADVYDALSSDRPYRPGMTPQQIVETMRGMAGPHLNRDIVGHFLSILPVFPVGLEVKVTQGRLAGSRGVVAKINDGAMDRPVVRILYDTQGRRVPAFDLDLGKEPSAVVAATFGLGGGLARAS